MNVKCTAKIISCMLKNLVINLGKCLTYPIVINLLYKF